MAAPGRLIAVLAAEVADGSRPIRAEKGGALEPQETHRDQLIYRKIAEHYGCILTAAGDSLLVEFDSPIDAVACAVELQSGMTDHDIGPSPDQWVTFRFGIEIGEVTAGGDDLVSRAVAALPTDTLAILIKPGTVLYGYTGNIATRLAALAEPAGICISGAVRDAIRDQLPYVFEDIGRRNLDIRAPPVHCYVMSAVSLASRPHLAGQNSQSRHVRLRSAAVAVSVFATAGVCGVVLWTWLGATAPRTPTPAVVAIGSHPALVGNTANGAAFAGSVPQIPPVSNTVGTEMPESSYHDLPYSISARAQATLDQRRRCNPHPTAARLPSVLPKRRWCCKPRPTMAGPQIAALAPTGRSCCAANPSGTKRAVAAPSRFDRLPRLCHHNERNTELAGRPRRFEPLSVAAVRLVTRELLTLPG